MSQYFMSSVCIFLHKITVIHRRQQLFSFVNSRVEIWVDEKAQARQAMKDKNKTKGVKNTESTKSV